MDKCKDLTGQKFGRLEVIKRIENDEYRKAVWLCRCDCGKFVKVLGANLRNGRTKSCGCYQKDITKNNTKHGYAHRKESKRLYRIWCGIKARCYNSHVKEFKHYGGKGIKVCEEWVNNFNAFSTWAESNGYNDTLTIDRIDNNKNYEPSNCRWVTRKEQSKNTSQNHSITFNGETKLLTEWSKQTGINATTILNRLNRGWSIEKTLTTPPRHIRKKP